LKISDLTGASGSAFYPSLIGPRRSFKAEFNFYFPKRHAKNKHTYKKLAMNICRLLCPPGKQILYKQSGRKKNARALERYNF